MFERMDVCGKCYPDVVFYKSMEEFPPSHWLAAGCNSFPYT